MSLQIYQREEEEVDECLFHESENIEDISHNTSVASLCQLLIHRSSGTLLNKSDKETIQAIQGTEIEKYDRLLEIIKLRTPLHPSLQLLDCIRCTRALSLPFLPPIRRTIIWVTPSSKYASIVVHTIQTMTLLDQPLPPHFWPVQRSTRIDSAKNCGYLYRICNLFTSIHTKLILVFPEEGSDEERDDLSLINAVQGSLTQWPGANLLVYTDILTGLPSEKCSGPILYKNQREGELKLIEELRKREESHNDSWSHCSEISREVSLYYQMMWLGRLLVEIENEKMTHQRSELLTQLDWDANATHLTDYQSNILSQNLHDWTNGGLMSYIKNETRYWCKDEGSIIGLSPSTCIRENLTRIPTRYFTQPPQIPERCLFTISETTDRLPEVVRNTRLPTLVTSGIVPAHLITPNFYHLAVQSCCRFTVECLLLNV